VSVSLFLDAGCVRPAGTPASLPMPFYPVCHDMSTFPPSSVVFDCYRLNKGRFTNFTFLLWENVKDCTGQVNTGIQSFGETNVCSPATITYMGERAKAWAHVTCDCDIQTTETDTNTNTNTNTNTCIKETQGIGIDNIKKQVENLYHIQKHQHTRNNKQTTHRLQRQRQE